MKSDINKYQNPVNLEGNICAIHIEMHPKSDEKVQRWIHLCLQKYSKTLIADQVVSM